MPKFVMKIYNCKFGAFPYAPYKVCNALVADFVKAVVKVQKKQKEPSGFTFITKRSESTQIWPKFKT